MTAETASPEVMPCGMRLEPSLLHVIDPATLLQASAGLPQQVCSAETSANNSAAAAACRKLPPHSPSRTADACSAGSQSFHTHGAMPASSTAPADQQGWLASERLTPLAAATGAPSGLVCAAGRAPASADRPAMSADSLGRAEAAAVHSGALDAGKEAGTVCYADRRSLPMRSTCARNSRVPSNLGPLHGRRRVAEVRATVHRRPERDQRIPVIALTYLQVSGPPQTRAARNGFGGPPRAASRGGDDP